LDAIHHYPHAGNRRKGVVVVGIDCNDTPRRTGKVGDKLVGLGIDD
jgi:hypothetical protein